MERNKDARVFQGGGSGEGLEVPDQVLSESKDLHKKILQDVANHSQQAIFREDIFETDQNRDGELWKSMLVARKRTLRIRANHVLYSPHRGPARPASADSAQIEEIQIIIPVALQFPVSSTIGSSSQHTLQQTN